MISHPKWWQLYLIFPLLLVLFAMDDRLKLSERGHEVVQIGIVMVVYGLIHLWLKANTSALMNRQQGQSHGRVTIIQVSPYQLAGGRNHARPMFQLPDSEIKGTLSSTFEIEAIDAEFFTLDEAAQELNKE